VRVEHRHGRSSSLVKAQTDILQLNFKHKVKGFSVRAVSLKNAKLEPGVHLLPRVSKFKSFSPRKQFTVAPFQQRRMHAFAIASAVTHLFIMHTTGVLWRST